jgi:pimeloyl-ACP methyl ester carboxylesterase
VHAVTVPTFVHDGLTLWYEESGAGAPVIFLAGIMRDHTQWGTVVPQLKGLRSITPDNRDIGNSSTARRDYSVRDMARDVLALMGHLDLERVSIVGHSLGGKIAQEVALLAPARIDRLVLVCSSAQHDIASRSLMELWISLREEIADSLIFAQMICLCAMGPDALAQCSLRDAVEIWMQRTELQRGSSFIRTVEASLASDTLARLADIQAPTLVIYSDCDRIFGPKHGEQLVAGIRGAQGVVMDGCGHAPMVERPEEFARLLQQFLVA